MHLIFMKNRYWLQGEEDIFLDPTTCAMAFQMLRFKGYDVSSGWIICKQLSACLEFQLFRREKKTKEADCKLCTCVCRSILSIFRR
jgi:hypothetical protein